MDIYYFYNGINNIIKLALKDKKYLANSKLILNDPLVILDFQYSSNLKGGSPAIATQLASHPNVQQLAKNRIEKEKDRAKDAAKDGAKDAAKDDAKENNKNESSDKEEKNSTNTSNNKEEEELSPKEKALKIIKVLFTIVYYLGIFSILPLLPFIAISYYSFKRLKIFYNEQMDTL